MINELVPGGDFITEPKKSFSYYCVFFAAHADEKIYRQYICFGIAESLYWEKEDDEIGGTGMNTQY